MSTSRFSFVFLIYANVNLIKKKNTFLSQEHPGVYFFWPNAQIETIVEKLMKSHLPINNKVVTETETKFQMRWMQTNQQKYKNPYNQN